MKKANILVVDDEKAILELFRLIFKNTGHSVITVGNGSTALEKFKDEQFDVIFLDVIMSGMDGLEVLSKIKRIKPETNVAMMTGSMMDDNLMEIVVKCGDGFFNKPFDIKSILDYVDKL